MTRSTTLLKAMEKFNAGNFKAALKSLKAVPANDPAHPAALHYMALCYVNSNDTRNALKAFAKAEISNKRDFSFNLNFSNFLVSIEKFKEALSRTEQALSLNPTHLQALLNKGIILRELWELDASCALLKGPAQTNQNAKVEYYKSLSQNAHAHARKEDLKSAVSMMEEAVSLDPENQRARNDLSLMYQMDEQFDKAWDVISFDTGKSDFQDTPYWDGSSNPDGVLVIRYEQGIGDQIQVYTFLQDVIDTYQGQVILECDHRMCDVMLHSFPTLKVYPAQTPTHPDLLKEHPTHKSGHAHLFKHMKKSAEDLKPNAGYLKHNNDKAKKIREKLSEGGKYKLVGISWGSPNSRNNLEKSVPLESWKPIFKIPGVKFIDLQYGDMAADRLTAVKKLKANIVRPDSLDPTGDLEGFLDHCGALDCIATISNATLHLGAAAGTPCFAFIAWRPLWYWQHNSKHSAWYDGVEFFRQSDPKSWQTEIEAMAKELESFLTN